MSDRTTKYAGNIKEALKIDARDILSQGKTVPAKLKASIAYIEQLEAENARLVEAIREHKKQMVHAMTLLDRMMLDHELYAAIEGIEQ